MRASWYITYDTVTPESAESGDYAESGFYSPGGWKTEDRPDGLTLREALSCIDWFSEDSGSWFSTVDPDTDYTDGSETFYSLHPPDNITSASYARVRRLLTGK